MEYIVELIAELIGNITGKCDPEKMPDDLELKKEFVVQPYPKSIVGWILVVILCFAIAPFAYLGNGFAFACVFVVLGIILLIIGAVLNVSKYKFDDKKITCIRLHKKNKVIFWDSVHCVKLYERTNDSSVALALYGKEKLLIDFVSPMKNFWNIQKLAEHLGYEIIVEKDPTIKTILHP